MTADSIPLTAEQVSSLRSAESDWLKMTPEQEQFLLDLGPGQVCTFYGDQILKISGERMAKALEVAFKTACRAALEMLGSSSWESVDLKCETPALGQMYLRVTATDDQGKKASAIGMIPDPRGH